MFVSSADANLMPSCARAAGVQVSKDRAQITVFVPAGPGKTVLRDMESTKRAALGFSRPTDERSLQLKGTVLATRSPTDAEVQRALAYRESFTQVLTIVGLPPRITKRFQLLPLVAVDVAVAEIFRQTPGPDAGAKLEREPAR